MLWPSWLRRQPAPLLAPTSTQVGLGDLTRSARKAVIAGSELNPDYWRASVAYLREQEREMAVPSLFDLLGAEAA